MKTKLLLKIMTVIYIALFASLLLLPRSSHAIDRDKRDHFYAGMGIGITITFTTKKVKFGTLSGCGAGLVKEANDSFGAGTVEFADFAYTCAGAYVGSWLIDKALR